MEYAAFLWSPLLERGAAPLSCDWSAQVTNDEVLTIKEVATLLKLAEKTVYSMAQHGEIPAFKVRGQWRIRKIDYDKWMEDQAEAVKVDESSKERR
jgi:excisionase family DNA binding protein